MSKKKALSFSRFIKRFPKEETCVWKVFNPDGELLKWRHHMIGNVKTFINGTYHGTST